MTLGEAAVARLEADDAGEVAEQALPRIGLLERLLRGGGEVIEVLLEDGVDQRVLGREAPVERAHPDACAAGDLLDAGIEPELGEGGPGGGEDPVAILARVAPERPGVRRRISGARDPLMIGWAGCKHKAQREPRLRLPRAPALVLAVLAVAAAGFAMLQSLVVPALPSLQQDLDTTPTGVTWIFTTYLLAASVATPIAGRLGDMFGKKRVLVVVLAGLAAGTLLAALATTLPVMIARPHDPGPRRRHLPARVRDHPRRVPARARSRAGSRSSPACSASAAASGSSSPARSSRTSTTTGCSGSRSS